MIDFFRSFHIKTTDYLNNGFKEFISNPQWFLMRRMGRFEAVRRCKTAISNHEKVPEISHNQNLSIFTDVNIDYVVTSLEKEGLYQGLQLPEDIVENILEFANSTNCYAAKDPKLGFRFYEKDKAQIYCKHKILLAKYFNTGLQCQAIQMLQNDPVLIEIAARYLKAKPVHIANSLLWSFPTNSTLFEKSKAAQVFHCDLDDYKFIKFFFYLTDVDINSGPHVYILGSHNRKKFYYQLLRGRATEKDLMNYYGTEKVVSITGPRGYGFAEDTFGYHKGDAPISNARLMLQVEFATKDYGTQHDFIEENRLKSLF